MNYHRNPDVYDAGLDGEICIFNPHNSNYVTLNETASFLWEILETPMNISQIEKLVSENYNIEKNFNIVDIKKFLDQAIENKFIIIK